MSAEAKPDAPRRLTARELATARVAVETRHRADWEAQANRLSTAIEKSDGEQVKFAKLIAETLKINQEGERKAWQLDRPPAERKAPQTKNGERHGTGITRIERVVVDPQHPDA